MTSPRLKSLLVRDFRSISGEWEVPLDASVVLIHGQNGAGKTSLLSALELAATGRISYLDRVGDDSYRNHLNHRGTKSGQVALETLGLDQRNRGAALVTQDGADCQPLLDYTMAETFVERCFLPQATLGRLFEVYAPKGDRSADSPLIRFVKEVLGLGALDALIDGLFPAADVRRVQKLSRNWLGADAQTQDLERRQAVAQSARTAAQGRVDRVTTDLASLLGLQGAATELYESILAAIEALVAANDARDSEAARLREAHLRLDAVESTLTDAELLAADPNEPETDAGLGVAEARYQEWKSSRSQPLRQWFLQRVSQDQEDVDLEPIRMLRGLRREIDVADAALGDVRRKLREINEIGQGVAGARSRITELNRDLSQLAEDRDAVASGSSAGSLASVLVSLLEHVDGEACPVCDQDFAAGGTLRQHIVTKVQGLNADASRLLELESRRAVLESESEALRRELDAQASAREQLGDAEALDDEMRAWSRQLAELKSLEPIGEAGQLLADEVARLRDARAESVGNRRLLERCLEELDQIASTLDADPPRGLLSQRIAALRAFAQAELDELAAGQTHLANALRLRDELEVARGQLDDAASSVAEVQAAIARLAPQIIEAKRRKEAASQLRKDAETLRTAITTRVFDERLNGSWARIFGALVPSEPFVPQFKPIPDGTRQVTVEIETIHKDGLEAATPAAMLSQGNLNTAALSLFVALHFAVPAQLPWLVFDDPVQSMDDLHISNFASIVKQLTRRNARQVVIAVHDRELFDYLSLELTPASPDEELLTILLDRTYGQSVISSERVNYTEDTALTPGSAA